MTAARAAVRVLGLVSTLVLARLLTPADFGIIAMATAVAAGLELLTLFGLDAALVRRKEIARDPDHLHPASFRIPGHWCAVSRSRSCAGRR